MDIFIFISLGLLGLLAGGTWLVQGAVGVAERLGLSPLLIGVVLVGFGTSTPELLTSVNAALAGVPDIAVGNVVGRNIANILLILGITALVRPAVLERRMILTDGGAMGLAALISVPILLSGVVGRLDGAILCAVLACYLVLRVRSGDAGDVPEADIAPPPLMRAALIFAAGLAITLLGAHLLVKGATDLALLFGISEAVIGVTIVAVGTSLPELVTSLIAARRRHSEMALGNILGSNIFNILGILGLTALIHPLEVDAGIAGFDQWVMLGATVALIAVGLGLGRLSRLTGALFLGAYAFYVGALLRAL